MVINQGGLEKILGLAGLSYPGSMASYLRCPLCHDFEAPCYQVDHTLRIFPTMTGDFSFRCHGCGTHFDSFEFLREALGLEPKAVSDRMLSEGITSRLYNDGELTLYELAARLRAHFPNGRAEYTHGLHVEPITQYFGDWGAFYFGTAYRFLPRGVISVERIPKHFLARQIRNIFGRVVRVDLFRQNYAPLGSYSFCREPVLLSMPAWTDKVDLNQLIFCDSEDTAEAIENKVAGWPRESRIAIAVPTQLDCFPVASRLPFSKVWFMARSDGEIEMGLSLYRRNQTEVKIRHFSGSLGDPMPSMDRPDEGALCSPDLPNCIDAIVDRIIHDKGMIAGNLSDVLSRPYIAKETKKELFQKCATASGRSEDELLDELEAGSNPYAILNKGRLFMARNGAYFIKDRKGRLSRISNFSIKSISKLVDFRGDATHQLLLSVEGKSTTFGATAALLDSYVRLWKEARRAAALAGLPELIMGNPQHRNFLPSLVKQTAIT